MTVVLILGLGAAAFFGAADFVGGLASRKTEALTIALASQALGLILLAVMVFVLPGARPQGADLAWGLGSGVSSGIAIALFYRALATGSMSIVAPITAVIAAAIPVALGLASGEFPGPVALVGVFVGLVAIMLVSRNPSADRTRTAGAALLCAFCAGISFGVTFFLLSRTSEQAGLWPLLSARTSAVTVLVIAQLVAGQCDLIAESLGLRGIWGYLKTCWRTANPLERRPFQRVASGFDLAMLLRTAPLAALTATLDVVASILFLFAVHLGMLVLVAVLISLAPACTMFLALLVLRERINLVQVIGLGAAIFSVMLIAHG